MTIKYYYDKIQKKYGHVAERAANDEFLYKDIGGGSCVAGYSYYFSPLCDAVIRNISINFSAATARDFTVTKRTGRGILKDLNDLLYIGVNGSGPYAVTLRAGFYQTAALLAAEVKYQLDNTAQFVSAGSTPFTVTFSASTDKFTITPSAGTVQYFRWNSRVPVRAYSTAGCVLGFNTDVAAASVTGDTALNDINTSIAILTKTDATTLTELIIEDITLDEDQAIFISTSAVNITARHIIDYIKLNNP